MSYLRNFCGWVGSFSGRNISALILISAIALLWNSEAQAQALLQQYQTPITVEAGPTDRLDKPVDAAIDLTAFLATVSGTLDLQSLQVVELDGLGTIIDDAVLFQFDQDPNFDPVAHAAGNLVFIMGGTTPAGTTRNFQLAFDVVGACPDCPAPPIVPSPVSVDSLTYENQDTYRVVTPAATYFYHKQGAGLASLIDQDTQDWISFHDIPGSGSAGEYRGIPNLVFRAGDSANSFFHPGFTNGTSQLVSAGPLKVTVRSQAGDPGNFWEVLWEFYTGYARLTILSAGAGDADPYWFLYEGTVGGAMDAGDVVVRSDGVQSSAYDYAQSWQETLPPPKWVYFRDTSAPRVLFVSDDQGVGTDDSYRPMGQSGSSTPDMTVFGFGRALSNLTGQLGGADRSFTLGFVEDHTQADAEIAGAVDDLTVNVGAPTTYLSFSPSVASVDCGETVDVDVMVANISDLQGFSLFIQLDPSVLAVDGVTLGTGFANACTDNPFFEYQYDAGSGVLRVDATLLGCSWNASFPQPLFRITMSPGASPGASDLVFLGSSTLRDSSNGSIGHYNSAGSLNNICNASQNTPPSAVVTSPAPGSVYQLGVPVPVTATASDTDGTVAQVEFLVDGAVIATDLAAPWETVWNGGGGGSHQVVARATDNEGATGVSPAVTFSINDPNGTPRVTGGLVALYDFAAGSGGLVPDVSGVGSPMDLTIGDQGAVTWLPGGGLSLDTATIVRSAGPGTKVMDAVTTSNAITVEAWLSPSALGQTGPARIVTCSADPYTRNFTLGQNDDRYAMRLRSTSTSDNGTPEILTGAGTLTTALTHVVYTRDAAGAVTIYLDGVLSRNGTTTGDFSNWDAGYGFALGNELSEDRPWLGSFQLVAVYDRALPATDIQQNFSAGPQGQPAPSVPVITSTALTSGAVGIPYQYDVEASGYPAVVFALAVAPAGMTIDPVTGLIDWTPGVVGDQAVEVTATNSEGSDNQAFTISVLAAPNVPPSAVVTGPTPGAVFQLGDPVPLTATASDSDGSVAQVEFLVDGAVVATVISAPWETIWNGGSGGSHQVTARATDNKGATGDSPAVAFSIYDPSGNSRVTGGLVALYDFSIGSGGVVPDVSGVGSPMDLTIGNQGAVTWLPGGGLSLDTATIVRSAGPGTKVMDAVTTSNAITVEAWLSPSALGQTGPARIVTCSADPYTRNFTLGQNDDRYAMRLRTTSTSDNGTPEILTGAGTLTTDLTHVVYTRDAAGTVTIYLDGVLSRSGTTAGAFSNWDAGYGFALGNELSEDRPWLGSFQLVAVYDRALPGVDIEQNFAAGPSGPPDPSAPVITSTALTSGAVGVAYQYDVEANGYPAAVFALAVAPAGMTIDPVSGLIDWTPGTVGDQAVEVTATNSEGSDSQAFTISVLAAPNMPPSAIVTSPSAAAVFQLGDPVPLMATASDTDGTVSQVEFLVDGAVVATVLAAPWETIWNGGSGGSHQVIARATDNEGTTGDSPAVAFSIYDPSGNSRVTNGLVVLYDFSSGSGGMVPDVSGVGSPMDLTIGDQGAVTWLPGGGLSLDTATIVRSAGPGTKVMDAVTTSNAITVEAWLAPGALGQTGPARIVTCSADPYTRNFTLGQNDNRYAMRLRTTSTSDNGTPEILTGSGTLTTDLTHVVYTRDAAGAVTIYLDGVLSRNGTTAGTFSNWNSGYGFALGNELSEDRPWLGSFHLVAVFDRALPVTEIQQNFSAGPQGQPEPSVPVITSTAVTSGAVGVAYQYDVEASGFPAAVFGLAVAPVGMTIDPVSGLIDWTPGTVGDQAVEVTATNGEGFDNQAFTIAVLAAPNMPPSALITSPSEAAVYQLGDPVPLMATVSDTDGTVSQVEFLVDGAVVATVLAAPWETVWNGGNGGSHQVFARATDNQGATGESPAVAFSIFDPSGNSRVTGGLVALYDFSIGSGGMVPDVSGVGSPMDLTIGDQGAVTWLPAGGLSLDTATIVRSAGPGTKVMDSVTTSNAITVEAWLSPSALGQTGPARIVTCSADPYTRNFTLGQNDDRYAMRLRTTSTSNNGTPEILTGSGTLTTDLTHVVYTRDAAGAVTIYLDGVLSRSGTTAGAFSNWDAGYGFALGNELSGDRPWLGSLYLVAVYDRALPSGDIQQNFAAGPSGPPDPSAPVITSTAVTSGAVGIAYQYDVEANGYPAAVFALAVAPAGMTIDPVSGLIDWTPGTVGDQAVEVTATNSAGSDNQAFTISVQAAPNVPPSAVVTSPASGSVYQLGDPVPLAATASDTDGTIAQVEFLVDAAVVATVFAAPWEASWNGGGGGSHQVVARATDNEGATGDSPAVAFSVNDPDGSARVDAGLVVLYDFGTGSGGVVPDVSGVGFPMNLSIGDQGAVSWLPGGGLSLDSPTIVRSTGPGTKVIDAVTSTNAITVEAWLAPGSLGQTGPARIVSSSADPLNRNFTLGQDDDSYVMRLRTSTTSNNGTPETGTSPGSLTTDLKHVVYTRDASSLVTIFIDGNLAESGFTTGDFSNWNTGYGFALGNELSEDRPWLGSFYIVAVYDRALDPADIQQNFAAGPRGQPVPSVPVITSSPVSAGTLAQAYQYDATASGYPVPVFGLATAPAGMTIDPVTGVVDWTPGVLGDHAVEITATNSLGTGSQLFNISVYPDNPVQVSIWHGLDQRVGHLGVAQPDFNVLGNVAPVSEVASLSYSVNGGLFIDLTIGPDNARLENAGDFNADIPTALLQAGPNTVTIRALGTTGQISNVSMNVTLESGGPATLPTNIDWDSVTDPQDVGQYVDGQWQLEGDALRVVDEGYDRIFLIGDENWQDYEILVPMTINKVYPGGAGLGFLMRFTGHVVGGHRNWPLTQPKYGYQPFGGIGWLRWLSGATSNPTMQFYYGDFDATDNFGPAAKFGSDLTKIPFGAPEMTESFSKASVTPGNTYWMRMRCETQPDALNGDGVTLYSWKIWDDGASEPGAWSWQVTQESQYALRQGGVGLLAHHIDASFGDVQITQIPVTMALAMGSDQKSNDDFNVAPRRFALHQNHPNPFNPATTIAFDVPRETTVGVRIYDLKGRMIRNLFTGALPQGAHTIKWDGLDDRGRGVAGGIYFLRLESAEFTATRKMTLVR